MRRRIKSLAVVSSIAFIILVVRLFALQVVESRRLSAAAVSQRAQGVPLETARGQIYDRNRIPLTDCRRLCAVAFPSLVTDKGKAALYASGLLDVDRDLVLEMLSRDEPVKIKCGVSHREAIALKEAGVGGVFVIEERQRYSPASLARHVIGYMGSAGEGLSGIEKAFDRELSGHTPRTFSVFVDATGKPVHGLGYRLLGAGEDDGRLDVVLTIDSRVQATVETMLDRRFRWEGPQACKGAAVVVLDARTGEILAMASRPDYDQLNVSGYLADLRSPLLNRAVSAYPPGSVFKIVVAAAAIEEGLIGLGEEFTCAGSTSVGKLKFECASAERGGHGVISFREALAESCNVVFVNVGQRVGAERLMRYAGLFGFGRRTGAMLAGESSGQLPDHRDVAPGDLANLSIGQWRLTATPLQVAQAMTPIVNSGKMLPVSLVKEVVTPRGLAVRAFPRPKPVQVMSASTAAWIRRSLLDAVRTGSAPEAFLEGVGSAGKTGSAETGRKVGDRNVLHAWFVGYAPAYAPRYICCVFVEEGGYGGTAAAPLFRDIMKELLRATSR